MADFVLNVANVQAAHKFEIQTEPIPPVQFPVEIVADAGVASPASSTVMVDQGADFSIEGTLNAGFRLVQILLDGAPYTG